MEGPVSGRGSHRLRQRSPERSSPGACGGIGTTGWAVDPGVGGVKKSLQHLAVPLEQRREVMRQLAERYPVQVICRVWETPRSSYYYQSQAKEEYELRTALQRLAGEWPRYGSRRLTAHLHREGFQVNRKHVQRLMRELGIQGHTYAK